MPAAAASMGFTSGIIGLPNVGKSTIFNALTGAGAAMASYAFTTIEPNRGIVPVPDPRLERIGALLHKPNPIPTTTEFIDIAGLVEGASRGEGLGNAFLGHIRAVDALVHVVRCFHSEDALHVMGSVDPLRDMDVITTELVLADYEHLERETEKLAKRAKLGEKEAAARMESLGPMLRHLAAGKRLRTLALSAEMAHLSREHGLITAKPLLYLANLDETGADPAALDPLRTRAADEGAGFLTIAGKLEEEIAELGAAEKREYLAAMGLARSGLDTLVEAAYRLLGLVTYYTATTDLQAWTIPEGTSARAAAGRIHSDFERGFIRAEVVHYDDLVAAGSEHQAREKGFLRTEGRDYVVRDGDVIHYLFNV
jgi:ribosome-binding ATPase